MVFYWIQSVIQHLEIIHGVPACNARNIDKRIAVTEIREKRELLLLFCPALNLDYASKRGFIAQLVEHRTGGAFFILGFLAT